MFTLHPILKQKIKKILYFGTKYYCNVCNSKLRCLKTLHTVVPREKAVCPVCGSLERHRMIWLYFKNETNLFINKSIKMLHVAPELCFIEQLSKLSHLDYLTGDLINPAMFKLDITNLQFPDNSFDVIYCAHVLEHIQDDRKAMREIARVLKPSGWAVLQVPIEADLTFEDPNITDPKEREKMFGQQDHVRVYGPDYKDRLTESGFQVQVVQFLETIDHNKRIKFGLSTKKDDIYLCYF